MIKTNNSLQSSLSSVSFQDLEIKSKQFEPAGLLISSRKTMSNDPTPPDISTDLKIKIEEMNEFEAQASYESEVEPMSAIETPERMSGDLYPAIRNLETDELGGKPSKTNTEKRLKELQNKLDLSIRRNSDLIHKIIKLNTKSDLVKTHLAELRAQESGLEVGSSHHSHVKHQINHCETQQSSLEIDKQNLINELNKHKEILNEQHQSLKDCIESLNKKTKIKGKLKEGVIHSLKIASECSSIAESIDCLIHFNRAGKLIKTYQKTKEEKELYINIINEINVVLSNKNEQAFKNNSIIENNKNLTFELIVIKNNLKNKINELEKKIDELDSINDFVEINLIKNEISQLKKSNKNVKTNINKLNSELNDLNKIHEQYSKEVAELNLSLKKSQHHIERIDLKIHDVEKEIFGEYVAGIASSTIEFASDIVDFVNYASLIGAYATHALVALQLVGGLISVAEPILHVVDLVLPILTIPFGIYEIGSSLVGYNEVRAQIGKLNKIKKVANELEEKVNHLKVQIDHNHVDTADNPSFDIKLEMDRLKALMHYREHEISRLQSLYDLQSQQFIENDIKQLPEYLEFNHILEYDNFDIENYESKKEQFIQSKLMGFQSYSPIPDQIEQLSIKLKEDKKNYSAYEKIELYQYQARILKKFVKRQKLHQANEIIHHSIHLAAGGALIGSGIAGIVSLSGVTSAASLPVATALSIAGTGALIGAFVEKGIFTTANKIYDAIKGSNEKFEDTEAGLMYSISLFIKEEYSHPSTENPITDSVLGYYGFKDPHRFVEKIQKHSHKKAKSNPKFASYASHQNKVIIHA